MPSALRRLFQSLARRLGLEPGEGRLLVLMGALVAILLGAYTIAKVLRDALFLQEFGALSLPYAYVGVALASAGYVFIESRVARRFARVGAAQFNQYAAIGFSLLAAAALPYARHLTAGLFYLWTGAQAMMLLPHFWGLALDVWNSRRARSLFPLLSGCGLLGGLAGGGFAAWSAPFIRTTGLIWVLSGLLIIARVLTGAIDRHRARVSDPAPAPSSVSSWEIMRKSGYIKILTIGLALSVVVGTLIDFQFKLLIQRMYPEPHALTQFLGAFYAGLNAVSLLFQFGAAGWLLQRLGLGTSTGLQPGAVLVLAAWAALTTGGWPIVAMRWIQGVTSQTLGKSSTEIYYAAIRPNERRRIKPALDTLIERWSDAVVGVLLLVALRLLHVRIGWIVVATAILAVAWLLALFLLNRQYGRAFQEALSRHWLEPDSAAETMRLPAARKAILLALRSDDERQVLLALRLSQHARDAATGLAVSQCLQHASPVVRAAAVDAMDALRLPDRDQVIDGLLADPDEGVRRAVVRYRLSRGREPVAFARRLLDGDDPALVQSLLDALFDHRYEARGALTWEWIDARLGSGRREDLLLAARALGVMEAATTGGRLGMLLANPDVEVRRAALLTAARRPSPARLDALLPLLVVSEVSDEARQAVAAIGDPAVPGLQRLLEGASGARAQSRAARVLSQIGSPRALDGLMTLARSGDLRLRHLGLQGLTRARVRTGLPVLPRSVAHRMFLRELRDYRVWLAPVSALEKSTAPAVRLLGESYRESADRALERAIQALACWYDPRPLTGVLERLRSRDRAVAAPAMEYLGHVLPRTVFQPASRVFEKEAMEAPEPDAEPDRLAEAIRVAWETGDAWLKACAVRASRHAPAFDRHRFATGDSGEAMIRAELEALSGAEGTIAEPRPC
jgi:AAA family ATP:ADP antiporter